MNRSEKKTNPILKGAVIGVLCLVVLLCGVLFLLSGQSDDSMAQNNYAEDTYAPAAEPEDETVPSENTIPAEDDTDSDAEKAETEPEAEETSATEASANNTQGQNSAGNTGSSSSGANNTPSTNTPSDSKSEEDKADEKAPTSPAPEQDKEDPSGTEVPEETVPEESGKIQVLGQVTAENNVVTQQATFGENGVSAQVPAGTLLNDNTTALVLTIEEKDSSDSGIALENGQELLPLDVHIEGISQNNTTPITVGLGNVLPNGMNIGNVTLYHVENGTANPMTRVFAVSELDSHNEFYYDPATGNTTVAMATFSEVAAVSETATPWLGNYDYSWYDAEATELTIANADQLAAFGRIVGGMTTYTDEEGNAITIDQDTFAGKTVKLVADVNLNDAEESNTDKIFHPIGYYYTEDKNNDGTTGDYYSTVYSFEGTFDGNGHTIANFYQNTWEIKGDYDGNYYNDAMGLFGYVVNGTVKNLTVDNFSSDGEFAPTGCVAAYACNATFENIAITNCNPRVYNTGNGGIVGIGGNSSDPDTYKLTFKNITIDNTNKITALWGSWDVACGGLVGMFRGAGHVYMTNCHVAAQIDVYNDVCGNYQYYWYRYAGMLVGTNRNMTTVNGYTVPETDKFHADGCTVHFGDWNDYYYCELVANTLASYTHDHQFSRLEQISSLDEIKNGDIWTQTGNFLLIEGDTKTCYHIVKAENGTLKQHLHTDAGEETVNGKTVLKEDKQIVYLPFNQLFTGYGWGVKNIPIYNDDTPNPFNGVTILDRDTADSVTKFTTAEGYQASFLEGTTVKVGDLFAQATWNDVKLDIDADNVQVFVSPVGENSTAGCTYTANTTDWTQGTVTFTGTGNATVTITDYYFCNPTVINVSVYPHTCTDNTLDGQWQPWSESIFTGHTADSMDGIVDGVKDSSKAYNNNVVASGHYYLTADTSLDRIIDQRAGADITICLNGYTLTGPKIEGEGTGKDGRIFRLVNGSTVTICDCSESGSGVLKANDNHNTAPIAYAYGEGTSFTMKGGTIDCTGFKAKTNGGAIYAQNQAVVTLENTTIQNAAADNQGGAIYASDNAVVNLNKATITKCSAYAAGGAIYCVDAEVNLTNGTTISDCSVTKQEETTDSNGSVVKNYAAGGAIYCGGAATVLNLTDTIIDGCDATGNGGALTITNGTVTISGTTEIKSCTAGFNGAALYISGGSMIINNVSIHDNTASERAAAIFLSGADVTVTMHDGKIYNNSTFDGGTINVSAEDTFIMKGGEITGNHSIGHSIGSPTDITNVCGVSVNGKFVMTGGSIHDNEGPYQTEDPTKAASHWSEIVGSQVTSVIQISGGTIDPHDLAAYAVRAYRGTAEISGTATIEGTVRFDDGNVTISGGTVYSISAAKYDTIPGTTINGSVTISGGTFGTDVTKYLEAGSVWDPESKGIVPCTHEGTMSAATCTTPSTCSACRYTVGEAAPDKHVGYTDEITQEATCTEAGVTTHTCACGDSYTEEIPATGHNYADGTCANCGEAEPGQDNGEGESESTDPEATE